MARVLIVNADNTFSMTLGFALPSRGHTVEVARSGDQALAKGFETHPELTIVDWMLSGHLTGLQVADALRTALETTRTMMVTGFFSDRLRDEAASRGISIFMERSLEVAGILEGIDKALEADPQPSDLPVGFVQYDAKGRGRFASTGFRKLFGVIPTAPATGLIERIFSYYSKNDLLRSHGEWLELKKRDASRAEYLGYVRKDRNGNALVVFRKDDENLKNDPVVRTILGLIEPPPIPERFIIIDENELQTRLAKTQIENAGCRCHTARSLDVGLQMVKADPGASSVLLDFRTAGELDEAVRQLKGARPMLKIVGMCTGFRKREFEAAGVKEFLVKPVIASVLFKALRVPVTA